MCLFFLLTHICGKNLDDLRLYNWNFEENREKYIFKIQPTESRF